MWLALEILEPLEVTTKNRLYFLGVSPTTRLSEDLKNADLICQYSRTMF